MTQSHTPDYCFSNSDDSQNHTWKYCPSGPDLCPTPQSVRSEPDSVDGPWLWWTSGLPRRLSLWPGWEPLLSHLLLLDLMKDVGLCCPCLPRQPRALWLCSRVWWIGKSIRPVTNPASKRSASTEHTYLTATQDTWFTFPLSRHTKLLLKTITTLKLSSRSASSFHSWNDQRPRCQVMAKQTFFSWLCAIPMS